MACGAALALSGDPHEPAKPDSRIVRRLMDTPIPAETTRVNYVAPALEMLAQPTASAFASYLERAEWHAALGEPRPPAATVGEAIAAEARAEPLDALRSRAFAKILAAELARPSDVLPEGVRANRDRYRQVSPWVWEPVDARPDVPIHLLHLALTNAGRRDIAGLRADLVTGTDPPVGVQCNPDYSPSSQGAFLNASQRRVMFCATDWQKRVPLQALVEAAQAVADGKATITVKPRWVLLQGAAFDLQHAEPGGFFRRAWNGTGVDHAGRGEAAALVRDSSCLDRGTCLGALEPQSRGGGGAFAWVPLGAGVVVFAIVAVAGGLRRVRAKVLWIVTTAFALVPLLAMAFLMGQASAGMGALIIPVMLAYAWVAWAAGFWGAWLLTLPLLRKRRESAEVDDAARSDAA